MKINVRRGDAVRLHARWILYFHEVIQAGSIRGAAKTLNVAPSAISRQLKEIEAVVGSRLMERGPDGWRLTAAGEVVADHVSQVLRGLGRMQGSLEELRGLRRGHVTVAAIRSAAPDLLPRIIASLHRKHPRITFSCEFVGSRQIGDAVMSGEFDIGISFNPPSSKALRHLIAVPLPFGAVMRPDHELAQRTTLRLYDLVDAGVPMLFPNETISIRAMLDEVLKDSALEVQPAVISANRDFIVSLAKFGVGIAFQTTLGIEDELRTGALAFVPLVDPDIKPPMLTVVVPALRPQSPSASLTAEAIRAEVASLLR
jgi:DNA-binding transcriptional LysR family regulator